MTFEKEKLWYQIPHMRLKITAVIFLIILVSHAKLFLPRISIVDLKTRHVSYFCEIPVAHAEFPGDGGTEADNGDSGAGSPGGDGGPGGTDGGGSASAGSGDASSGCGSGNDGSG